MAECCLCNVVLEVGSVGGVELLIDNDPGAAVFNMGDPIIIGGSYETYGGTYDVTPKVNVDQILETKDKLMEDDVTVHEITIASVSNPSGGTTVTIGIV